MGDGVGEKTRKWGRNIKHGVGFFHAAAVIAATEEEGNNARMADQGRERGWLRRRREKQPFLVAVRRPPDLLALSAE